MERPIRVLVITNLPELLAGLDRGVEVLDQLQALRGDLEAVRAALRQQLGEAPVVPRPVTPIETVPCVAPPAEPATPKPQASDRSDLTAVDRDLTEVA